LNNLSASGAFLYVFGFVALFGLYWLGLRRGLRAPTQAHWIIVAGFAVVFSLALLPMYPADAADVYDYVLRGRMTTLYGLNPMRDLPTQARFDPFYDFASLREQPSAYGPAWEVLAALASRLAGDDRNTNVIVFKFVSVVGYGLIGRLIGLTLRRVAPRRVRQRPISRLARRYISATIARRLIRDQHRTQLDDFRNTRLPPDPLRPA
jgi:hypothetical protein